MISAALILFSILVLLTVVMTRSGDAPDLFGFSAFRVVTGSMEPTLPVDSLIVTRKTQPEEIREGDIITFYSRDPALAGSTNTHRVVAVQQQEDGSYVYRTKGDNNPVEDEYVTFAADVIGVVAACSPLLGRAVRLAANPLIFFPFLIVPLVVLLAANLLSTILAASRIADEEEEEAIIKRILVYQQAARDPNYLGTLPEATEKETEDG